MDQVNLDLASREIMSLLTTGYRPPPSYITSMAWLPGLPPFTMATVDAMRRDYQVKLAMSMKIVPVMKPKFAITGDPEVTEFVQSELRSIWTNCITDITEAMWYTRFGCEMVYKRADGDLVRFARMMPYHPRDFRILTKNGEMTGLRIVSSASTSDSEGIAAHESATTDSRGRQYLFAPKSFCYVHGKKFGSFDGMSELEGAYPSWMEKVREGGAVASRSLWGYKCMFDSGMIIHPEGYWQDPNDSTKQIPYREMALKIGEAIRNGSVVAVPGTTDDSGNQIWNWIRPEINQGGEQILGLIDHLDGKINKGIGITDDVIEQRPGSSTGGYAGRTIPFMAFLEAGTPTVRDIARELCRQALVPLAQINFGESRGKDWEITESGVNTEEFLGTAGAGPKRPGIPGDGDGDGVPYEDPQQQQMSLASIDHLADSRGLTGSERRIFTQYALATFRPNSRVTFVNEPRNRVLRAKLIQMSQHDVSGEARANDGKWTSGGHSFGRVLDHEEAKELAGKIRDGDASSKNGGRHSVRIETGPMVMSKIPTDFFDQFPDEDDGNRTNFIRSTTSPERVKKYAALDGEKLPPINVTMTRKGIPVLSDGGHRLMAAIARGDKWINALVPQSLHEHLHGAQMSQADDFTDMGQGTFAWDEEKHPRDHGKFAHARGGQGIADEPFSLKRDKEKSFVPKNQSSQTQNLFGGNKTTHSPADQGVTKQVESLPGQKVIDEPHGPHHVTKLPQFKAWFGDWESDPANASKVVNAEGEPQETAPITGTGSKVVKDGKPVTVYHGTGRGGFEAFDKQFLGNATSGGAAESLLYGPGFYFTEDKSIADEYSSISKAEMSVVPVEESQEVREKLIEAIETATGKMEKTRQELFGHLSPEEFAPFREDTDEMRKVVEDLKRGRSIERSVRFVAKGDAMNLSALEKMGVKTTGLLKVKSSREVKEVFLSIKKPFDIDNGKFDVADLPRDVLQQHAQKRKDNAATARKNQIRYGEMADDQRKRNATTKDALKKAGVPVEILKDPDTYRIGVGREGSEVRKAWDSLSEDKQDAWTDYVSKVKQAEYFQNMSNHHREMFEEATSKNTGITYGGLESILRTKTAVNKALQDAGYDGLTHIGGSILGGGHSHRVWIAFEPTQIKAVSNQGTFDPTNPNITMSLQDWIDLGQGTFNWEESKHPRDDDGKFASGPGGVAHVEATADEHAKNVRVSKDGTVWARAKAGGEKSPVNDTHYKGGQWMPIHGLTPKKEKAEPQGGEGSKVPPVANEDAKAPSTREPRPPMGPDQIEAERARRDNERMWSEFRDGPIGQLLHLMERPHSIRRTAPGIKQWEPFVAEIGESGVEKLIAHLEPMAVAEARKESEGRDRSIDSTPASIDDDMEAYREHLRGIADGSKVYHAKKHLKAFPESPYAAVLFGEVMDHADISQIHKLNGFLESLRPDGTQQLSQFEESKHPRGQPENAGEFSSKPSGSKFERAMHRDRVNRLTGDAAAATGRDELDLIGDMLEAGVEASDYEAQAEYLGNLIEANQSKPKAWEPINAYAMETFEAFEHETPAQVAARRDHWQELNNVRDRFRDDLVMQHTQLSNAKKTEYLTAVQDVLPWMSTKALTAMRNNILGTKFFPSLKALTNAVEPGAGYASIGGCWEGGRSGRGTLYLDGGSGFTAVGKAREIYAHEFTHAIDWIPDSRANGGSPITDTAEWQDAFNSEVAGGQLSEYAATVDYEGFAEFGRLLYGTGRRHSEIESQFPKCMAVFRKYGLVK